MTRIVEWRHDMASLGRAVIALGVFDGVHLGHQALVRDAVATAKHAGVSSVVVTFDRDPDRVVTPDAAAPQLLPLEDKLELLSELEPDCVLVIGFDHDLAETSPEGFVDDVLLPAVTPVTVVVGNDFRFGARAQGDVTLLARLGLARGFTVTPHELVTSEGVPVTSTRVRSLVARGDVVQAAKLLGRPHRVTGTVVPGRGDGRRIGVPTANVAPPPETAVPGDGVYAGRCVVDGSTYAAAVSVGRPPSFPRAEEAVEVHLLDFTGDLYGKHVRVEFVHKLRDLVPFASLEELTAAIARDIDVVRGVAKRP